MEEEVEEQEQEVTEDNPPTNLKRKKKKTGRPKAKKKKTVVPMEMTDFGEHNESKAEESPEKPPEKDSLSIVSRSAMRSENAINVQENAKVKLNFKFAKNQLRAKVDSMEKSKSAVRQHTQQAKINDGVVEIDDVDPSTKDDYYISKVVIEKSQYTCLLCKEPDNVYAYYKRLNDIKRHFARRHIAELCEKFGEREVNTVRAKSKTKPLPTQKNGSSSQGTLDKSVKSSSEILTYCSKYYMTRLIAEFVVQNNLALSVFSSPSWSKLMKQTRPDIQPIRSSTIRSEVEKMFEAGKEEIQLLLSKAETISMSVDKWTSFSQTFLGYTCFFVLEEREYSICLDLDRFYTPHDSESLKQKIEELLQRWKISKEKVVFVTDSEASQKKAFELMGVPWYPCVPHQINLAFHETLVKCSDLALGVDSVHTIVKKIRQSPKMSDVFQFICEDTTLKSRKATQEDAMKLFEELQQKLGNNEKNDMIDGDCNDGGQDDDGFVEVLESETEVDQKQALLEEAKQLLKTMDASLSSKVLILSQKTRWNSISRMLKRFVQHYHDVVLLQNHVNLLKEANFPPLEMLEDFVKVLDTIESLTLASQKSNFRISCVHGLWSEAKKQLRNAPTNYQVSDFQTKFLENLEKRLRVYLENSDVLFATLLHPSRAFTLKNDLQVSEEALMEAERKLQLLIDSCDEGKAEEASSLSQSTFGTQVVSRVNPVLECSSALSKGYIDNSNFVENPLKYWKAQGLAEKHLKKIEKIFGPLATAAAVERVFSTAGDIRTKKRSKLTNIFFMKLLFVSKNFNIIQNLPWIEPKNNEQSEKK